MSINRCVLLVSLIVIMGCIPLASFGMDKGADGDGKVKVLAFMDHGYGSSYNVTDPEFKSIKEQFEGFGWEITVAGPEKMLKPCPWSAETFGEGELETDALFEEINDISVYDALVIMPGRQFENIIANEHAMALIKQAEKEGLVVAAWCRAVQVLAKADLVRGKKIIGNFNLKADYEAAGADYVDYKVVQKDGKRHFEGITPPVRDGNIITTVRSRFYRNEMCELIKEAVESSSYTNSQP